MNPTENTARVESPQASAAVQPSGQRRVRLPRWFTTANLLMGALCLGYVWLFVKSISPYWFHPGWTTDDALQQVYPFHKVHNPGIFEGDLITTMMECYLAPLHYWMSWGITWLTGDPIMMSHWMMLIQVSVAVGFFFLAARAFAGTAPAFFAVLWLLHTRLVMQRLTGGLPRGWSLPLFAAAFYFVATNRHRAVLVTMFLGCLLHPPGTLVIALAYGTLLLWRAARPSTRAAAMRPLMTLVLLSPLYIATTIYVTRMPEEVGTMASLERAAQMPQFRVPDGRFPFLPFRTPTQEIRQVAFQAFAGRLHNPGATLKQAAPVVALVLLALIVIGGLARRRKVIPAPVWWFGFAAMSVYFASRVLAFHLYVPNRHLQIPMAVFFILAVTVGLWRLLHAAQGEEGWRDMRLRASWQPLLALLAVGAFVYSCSGLGLNGTLNFNYPADKRGGVFAWIREHTPREAVIAGHPTFIDPVQLFGMRRGYVTTETSHPFYDRYYAEMERRLEVSLRAHFARDWEEFLSIVEPEGINYFVFQRDLFRPQNIVQATYYPPLDTLVQELTAGNTTEYAYLLLPKQLDLEAAPFMVFNDRMSALIDVRKLREYLNQGAS